MSCYIIFSCVWKESESFFVALQLTQDKWPIDGNVLSSLWKSAIDWKVCDHHQRWWETPTRRRKLTDWERLNDSIRKCFKSVHWPTTTISPISAHQCSLFLSGWPTIWKHTQLSWSSGQFISFIFVSLFKVAFLNTKYVELLIVYCVRDDLFCLSSAFVFSEHSPIVVGYDLNNAYAHLFIGQFFFHGTFTQKFAQAYQVFGSYCASQND